MSDASPDTPEFIGMAMNDKDGAYYSVKKQVLESHGPCFQGRSLISLNLRVLIFKMKIIVPCSQDGCEN